MLLITINVYKNQAFYLLSNWNAKLGSLGIIQYWQLHLLIHYPVIFTCLLIWASLLVLVIPYVEHNREPSLYGVWETNVEDNKGNIIFYVLC